MHTIREDFDRIASLPGGWDHNGQYHAYLLRHLPPHISTALDVGCGTGEFTRLLADRADHVVAIDLSPRMIEVAQERSVDYANIDYLAADILEWDFPLRRFDCISSIATFHHLPVPELAPRIRGALADRGVLLALDLFKASTPADYLVGAVAFPASAAARLIHTGRLTQPREVKAAWAEHGRHDRYLALPEVRELCAGEFPGAAIRRHLFWRYSLIWRKA